MLRCRRGGVVDHGGHDDDGGPAHELRREVTAGETGRVHRGGDDAVEYYRSRGGESLEWWLMEES